MNSGKKSKKYYFRLEVIKLAVKIRLRRVGRKHQAVFRLVAADSHSPRDGKFIEHLGYYDPKQNPPKIVINEERVIYWHRKGAKPTASSSALIKKAGINLS